MPPDCRPNPSARKCPWTRSGKSPVMPDGPKRGAFVPARRVPEPGRGIIAPETASAWNSTRGRSPQLSGYRFQPSIATRPPAKPLRPTARDCRNDPKPAFWPTRKLRMTSGTFRNHLPGKKVLPDAFRTTSREKYCLTGRTRPMAGRLNPNRNLFDERPPSPKPSPQGEGFHVHRFIGNTTGRLGRTGIGQTRNSLGGIPLTGERIKGEGGRQNKSS